MRWRSVTAVAGDFILAELDGEGHFFAVVKPCLQDVRAIWLRHLSPHWSPGLIRLIWLARRVSPSSLTAPCASLPKLRAPSKRTTIPDRGGPVFGQGYTSSCAPLLEPPNKRTFKQIHIKDFFHLSPFYLVSFIFIPEGSHITLCTTLLFWHFCEEKL